MTVDLSGKDLIVETELVSKYVASKNASCTSSSTDSSFFLIDVKDVLLVQVNGKAVEVCASSTNSTADDEGGL